MKQLFAVAFALCFVFVAYAQKKSVLIPAAAETAGMSSSRLLRIDTMLKGYIDRGAMNGVTALIARDGKIVYHKSFGYADVDDQVTMKTDAIFRIASQTKAITSVAVMILYEEGKILLDDPVSQYIPEFSNAMVIDSFNLSDTSYTTVPAKRAITIRDLLTHTSGIGYAEIGSREANAMYGKAGIPGVTGVNTTLEEQIRKVGRLPLFHHPGEKWTYGLNTDVLGYLVEVVSGMSLAQFMSQKIFQPLGMKDTYFFLPPEKHNRLVGLYSDNAQTGRYAKMAETYRLNATLYRDFPKMKGTYYSGGAGLSSTILDYAIFLQMLLNGGEYNGKRILSRPTVRMMTMNQIGDLNLGNNKFGLGFGITTEKGSAVGPASQGVFDWGGMYATTYWVDPKERLVGLLFRNMFPTRHGQIPQKFKVMTYAAIAD